MSDTVEYRRIEGIWYELTLRPLAAGENWAADVCLMKKCCPAPRTSCAGSTGGSFPRPRNGR